MSAMSVTRLPRTIFFRLFAPVLVIAGGSCLATEPPLIVIAAGGSGSRIGGDKPEHMLGNVRLIDRAVQWARERSDAVALAVRPGDGDWGTDLPLLFDKTEGIGPVSALNSALQEGSLLRRQSVLLMGCDLPFLPGNLVSRLSAALPGHGVAMPVSSGQLHPMAALWRSETKSLDRWIAKGGQSLWRFAMAIGMAQVEWAETPDPFTNVNDAEGLSAAEERIRTTGQ
jgi:molybdopterin-guanine dinucleotide biosynthesis protein A